MLSRADGAMVRQRRDRLAQAAARLVKICGQRAQGVSELQGYHVLVFIAHNIEAVGRSSHQQL